VGSKTRLLRGSDIEAFDALQARTFDSEIGAAQHRADVTKIAIAELDIEIDRKQLQVKRLRDREHSFAKDALLEHVAAELGPKTLGKRFEQYGLPAFGVLGLVEHSLQAITLGFERG
jgi:hypothetical protein